MQCSPRVKVTKFCWTNKKELLHFISAYLNKTLYRSCLKLISPSSKHCDILAGHLKKGYKGCVCGIQNSLQYSIKNAFGLQHVFSALLFYARILRPILSHKYLRSFALFISRLLFPAHLHLSIPMFMLNPFFRCLNSRSSSVLYREMSRLLLSMWPTYMMLFWLLAARNVILFLNDKRTCSQTKYYWHPQEFLS